MQLRQVRCSKVNHFVIANYLKMLTNAGATAKYAAFYRVSCCPNPSSSLINHIPLMSRKPKIENSESTESAQIYACNAYETPVYVNALPCPSCSALKK